MSALERLVPLGSRVLDVGVRDWRLADALDSIGVHRYLGLVLPEDREGLGAVPVRLKDRFHPLIASDQVRHNDTDVLVLRAPVARMAWGIRDLGHVSRVAIERDTVSTWLETHGSLAMSRLLGRVEHLGHSAWGGSRFEVFEVRRRRRARPRHYLSEAVGVPGLLERLASEGLDYVVLRWFEQLPHLDAGEDLDVLVADRHLNRLHEILAEEPGTIPVDIYSESGLEGADFRGMAYYPPRLATQVLARAQTHTSGARVPSGEDHLLSLAYHATYHKGCESGLASALLETRGGHDHDYAAALTAVAQSLGRTFPTVLEEIDDELLAQGWRPPLDTLRRLANDNPWVRERFFPVAEEQLSELPEPAVFFLRDRTRSVLDLTEVIAVIESLEFEILAVRELTGSAATASTELVRGGNWGPGPFPVSGGGPVVVVVAAHYGPRRPNHALRARYPRLTNGDVLHAKVAVRELIEAKVGAEQSFNPIHSSDDEFETWEYLEIALPDEMEALRSTVRQRRGNYRTAAPVVGVLSRGRRAKVEVIEDAHGRPVARKTFAPHGQRHMKREIETMRKLSPRVNAVPALLRTGPNWFETEFFPSDLSELPDRPNGRLVPLRVARDMVEVLREIHAQGYDLVDAKPQNFLLDPGGELRLVDFEFSHRYPGTAPDFDRIYSFVGPPADFAGDLPFGELSYESRWQPFVGLSRHSLLYDPIWLQHLRRSGVRATGVVLVPAKLLRSGLRHGRSGLRAGRLRAGASYRRWARARARIAL